MKHKIRKNEIVKQQNGPYKRKTLCFPINGKKVTHTFILLRMPHLHKLMCKYDLKYDEKLRRLRRL